MTIRIRVRLTEHYRITNGNSKRMDSIDLKEIVTNPEIIDAIFKDETFSLSELTVLKVHLNNYNRTAFMHADLNKFPTNPPKKWVIKKFNTAQITLQIIDIDQFRCDGLFIEQEKANLNIIKRGDRLAINLFTNNVYLSVAAGWLQIDKIEGYQKDVDIN